MMSTEEAEPYLTWETRPKGDTVQYRRVALLEDGTRLTTRWAESRRLANEWARDAIRGHTAKKEERDE